MCDARLPLHIALFFLDEKYHASEATEAQNLGSPMIDCQA